MDKIYRGKYNVEDIVNIEGVPFRVVAKRVIVKSFSTCNSDLVEYKLIPDVSFVEQSEGFWIVESKIPETSINQRAILKEAQETYGVSNQMSVVAEECCELAAVCNKYIRYPDHETAVRELRDKIISEVADVTICLEHIIMIFGIDREEGQAHMSGKLQRLERWLSKSKDMLQTTIDRDVEVKDSTL